MSKRERKIIKGIKDAKENKVTRVTNVEDLFKDFRERRKRHPIYYFFYDIYRRIYNFIDSIPLNVKTFIQRGKRGWANSDTWDFAHYLSKVIFEGLSNLKKYQHGNPADLTEGQWIDILNKIIYTFRVAKDIASGDVIYMPTKEWSERKYKKWTKGLKDINKKYGDNMRVLTKTQAEEFEEGFQLFQKYFFCFWD